MMELFLESGGMLEGLLDTIRATSNHPWAQGWATAIATFFFENVVCWTIVPPLISEGILGTMVALQSTFWGVFIGDLLMYLPVRFAMQYVARLKWVQKHQDQIEACGKFFDKHIGKTMFVIRFTPGIRTPALLAAGLLKVNFLSYTIFSALSCLFQSCIVVYFMPSLYRPVLDWMKSTWATSPLLVSIVLAAFFIGFIVLQWRLAKVAMRRITHKDEIQAKRRAKKERRRTAREQRKYDRQRSKEQRRLRNR
ncbi:MAG: VTT domain-containing protein [bacterium]|nr:VTT domain-containing protein [bacterium]MDO5462119.1 VTT domain-containing protein [bacterium]